MAEVTQFRNIILFFQDLGIYDVVLPFVLVFTIVFAILEKTKVFGTEKLGDVKYTKKNLNAMTAFVISFLVVASSKIVAIINESLAKIVLLLLVSVCFLMLVGSFMKEREEGVFLEKGWQTFFMFFMFIGLVIIFLTSIKDDNGLSWWEILWSYVINNWNSTIVGSIALVIVIVLFMYFITKSPEKKKEEKKD